MLPNKTKPDTDLQDIFNNGNKPEAIKKLPKVETQVANLTLTSS